MKKKWFFLVLAAVLLIAVLCWYRSHVKEESTQTPEPVAQDVEPESQAMEPDAIQETEDTGRPDEAPDSQLEESPPVEATQEEEISEPEATDNYEVEIDDNQGIGGL